MEGIRKGDPRLESQGRFGTPYRPLDVVALPTLFDSSLGYHPLDLFAGVPFQLPSPYSDLTGPLPKHAWDRFQPALGSRRNQLLDRSPGSKTLALAKLFRQRLAGPIRVHRETRVTPQANPTLTSVQGLWPTFTGRRTSGARKLAFRPRVRRMR